MKRVALALLLLAAQPIASRAAPPSELVVFAATSLREGFTEIAAGFEREHAGIHVVLDFAGSQDLVAQIEHGALADVFASADAANMQKLVAAKLVAEPHVFARNAPVLVTAPSLAESIHGLADLPRAKRIVLGVPEVPIGRYARQILDRAGERYGADFRRRVEERVVSNELNVRQVLAKVMLGEADAAIVYSTDAATAGDRVRMLDVPAEINLVAEYPIAVLAATQNRAIAEQWVSAVLAPSGQAALVARGFLPTGVAQSDAR